MLTALRVAGVGCYMFIAADYIVLITSTVHAMQCILKLCDEYAQANISVGSVCFYIGSMCIENVHNWPHLGRVISNDGGDKQDTAQRRCKFIGQFNNVLCWFGKLDSTSKTRVLKSYCFDFYGCEV